MKSRIVKKLIKSIKKPRNMFKVIKKHRKNQRKTHRKKQRKSHKSQKPTSSWINL